MLGLGFRLNRGVLGSYLNKILRYSVGDWGINSSTIRLRRDDDDFEKEFDPVAGVLDVASITDFNSWNMLDGGAYRDFLYDVPLGVDSNLDGVSDGWVENSSSTVATLSIEEDAQKIEVTDSSIAGSRTEVQLFKDDTPLILGAGAEFTFKVTFKTQGDCKARVFIQYRNGAGDLLSQAVTTSQTSTEFTDMIIKGTIDASADRIWLIVSNFPDSTGAIGTVWYKDAILVENSFIENIGLLTEDDNSDGVANEWSYTTGGYDGTILKTVSENGQKLEILGDATNVGKANTFVECTDVSTGDTFELSFEARVTGDVLGKAYIVELPSNTAWFSADLSSSEWTTLTATATIASGTTSILNRFQIDPNLTTSSGTVEYRNVTLKQTNNSTDDTKVFDKSGKGNHAVQTTADYQPALIDEGVVLDALLFDATNDYLEVPNDASISFTSDFSILVKFKINALASSCMLLSKSTTNLTDAEYAIRYSGSALNLNFYLDGGIALAMDNSSVTTGVEHTAIFTWDGTTVKIYYDGVLNKSGAYSTPIANSGGELNIGAVVGTSNLDGFMYRSIILNKVLTESEALYLTSKV